MTFYYNGLEAYKNSTSFFNKLTNAEDLIKLQTEWETTDPIQPGHATIPFLDLLIKRSPTGFSFSIYRKPTATDLYTHFYSSHPLSTKKGVLIGLFLRGFRLCSPEALPGEIEHIRSAFLRLRYPAHVINQALSIAKRRFYSPTTSEQHKSKYHLTLPYHPELEPLRPALKKIDVSTSFSSSNTLGNLLSNTGPLKSHENELPGVYKVECKQCPDGVYFGETGVTLAKRMTGHRSDIRNANESNALFVHMKDNFGHSFDLKGAKLIYKSNQKSNRQLVESSLIASNVSCNLKPGDYPVCRITAPVILKSIKLENLRNSIAPQPTVTPISNTAPSVTLAPVIPSTTAPTPVHIAPIPDTSNLTQALCNMAISPSIQPQIVTSIPYNQPLVPSPTSFTPIARHTRSHHQLPAAPSPLLQSQARSLPFTHIAISPAHSHTDSPSVKRTHSNILLSQCYSPKATTGATRKRRFVNNHISSPDIFSPMVKRLRSSKISH